MSKTVSAVISAAILVTSPTMLSTAANAAESEEKVVRQIGPIPNMMAVKLKDVGESTVELSTADLSGSSVDEAEILPTDAVTFGAYEAFEIPSADITGFDGAKARFKLPDGCSPGSDPALLACEFGDTTFSTGLVDAAGATVPFVEKVSGEDVILEILPETKAEYPLEATLFIGEDYRDEEGSKLTEIAAETFVEFSAQGDAALKTDAELYAEEQELNADAVEPEAAPEPAPSRTMSPLPSLSPHAAKRPSRVSIPSKYYYCPKCKKNRTLHDYCSYSRDKPSVRGFRADFRGPCARHDMGIESMVRKNLSKSRQKSIRKQVDSKFKNNLYQQCSYQFHSNYHKRTKNACKGTAATYYGAVSVRTWSLYL